MNFRLLGRFEVFAEAMSLMAGFGLRACLAVQSFNQIYEAYGRHETITSNCDTTVAVYAQQARRPREEISRLIGRDQVRHAASHAIRAAAAASPSPRWAGR